eukprot:gene7345-8554_t
MDEIRDEVKTMLADPDLRGADMLFFCNKQDDPHAMSPAQITDHLQLNSIRDRQWYVQSTIATRGEETCK